VRAALTVFALITAATQVAAQSPAATCWVRGDPARLAGRPSPLDSAQVTLGNATIKLCYGRPSARGRVMVGGQDPFNQPWRLGANEATTIHLPVAADIGGVRVEPGSYSLYAIPSDTTWQVVVNRSIQRWGIPINEQVRAQDVGAATARVERLAEPVETLTLRFGPVGGTGNATELVIEWERTRVRVPIRRV
jgi:DUF2911 family protein